MGVQEQGLALRMAGYGTGFGAVCYIPSVPLDLEQ